MKELKRVFNGTDRAVFNLRALYGDYGFKQYRMSKFEKYDLYAKNKDFLVSDNVITFTDTDGVLMALKPDVTLSIIKNGKDGAGVEKVYYNENVYRVSKGTRSFKEFMQVGLECFGDIDEYEISEVLFLAVKSLETVSNDYILDLSHLAVVKGVMEKFNLSADGVKKITAYLAEKNAQGVFSACKEEGLDDQSAELIKKLVTVYGAPEKVIKEFKSLDLGEKANKAICQLERLINALCTLDVSDKIRIDFSVVNDMNYYNGIVFNGFVSGIPTSIISGGQYDNLMAKFGRKDRAIGFAVYLDELKKLASDENGFDVDVAIEYGATNDIALINKKVKEITSGGESVFASKKIPQTLKYKRLVKLGGEE